MTTLNAKDPGHPIGVVAERTGLTTDVLRIWERRYGVVEPQRDEAGRRLYTDLDIERLRLLARATAAGRSIGQLAELSHEELTELVRGDEAARRSAAPSTGTTAGAQVFVDQALERVRALDGEGLEALLRRAAALLGMPVFLETVAAPLFRRIGEEWHAGRLTPVHEHLASAVVRPLLSTLRGGMPASAGAPALVVATPAGEPHEIGALLVAAAGAVAGWRTIYLGPDLPADEIARGARETGARAVAVSLVYVTDPEALLAQLAALRQQLPAGVPLLAGGGAAAGLEEDLERVGILALRNLQELRTALDDIFFVTAS
ncbi:MAG: MerR family transcriptional regulator [Gemmatimonadetes bacterium]|nr:MerR family transcriptional regulator [Gemmatimonadota bacterium]